MHLHSQTQAVYTKISLLLILCPPVANCPLTLSLHPDFLKEMLTLYFISSFHCSPWLLVPSDCSWQAMNGFIAQSSWLFSSLLYLVANSIADLLAFETFPLISLTKPHSGFCTSPSGWLLRLLCGFPFSAFPLIVSLTLGSVSGF